MSEPTPIPTASSGDEVVTAIQNLALELRSHREEQLALMLEFRTARLEHAALSQRVDQVYSILDSGSVAAAKGKGLLGPRHPPDPTGIGDPFDRDHPVQPHDKRPGHEIRPPKVRVDAPKFNGTDPNGWVYKAQSYFDYFHTPEADRLRLVGLLFDHPASDWFLYQHNNGLLTSWSEFLEAVKQRFDPAHYEDYVALLSKLQQRTSVLDYQTAFERLLNIISGVSEPTLISIFKGGLKPAIRREVNLRAPTSLGQTFALARELDANHSETLASISAGQRRSWQPNPASSSIPPKSAVTQAPTVPTALPVRRLSPADRAARSAQGLCWNCDEKFTAGHRCAHRFLALLGTDDEEPVEPVEHQADEEPLLTGDVSCMHSLAGAPNPRALRLSGRILGRTIQILIDGGSTHNFIHPQVAESLRLPLEPIPPFRVYVGNGASLACTHKSVNIRLTIQGHDILSDLFVLSIHGTDVVLGVQWLQSLGKISQDYANLTLEFRQGDSVVTLRGDTHTPQGLSYNAMHTLHGSREITAVYEVYLLSSGQPENGPQTLAWPPDIPSAVMAVLTRHAQTGASNRVADALSRREESDDTAVLFTLYAQPLPKLLDRVRSENSSMSDPVALHTAATSGTLSAPYSVHNGILYYHHRVCLSTTSNLKGEILQEFHSSPSTGHPGIERTFRRVAAVFFWPHMRRDIAAFVASCLTCQATKYSTQKPGGLLQPLPVPGRVWDDVTMDFIVGLPPSKGMTSIMVVVDRLTKYGHFGPLPTSFDAAKAASLFVEIVVRHHGFPASIVSDRDPIFISNFWKELFRLSGTTLKRSTAYHPQSDGQTEVCNRDLEQYLRAYCHERPSTWVSFLPWAELALNSTYHAGLKTSPFKALYGRDPPPLLSHTTGSSRVPSVEALLQERGAVIRLLRKNLISMQQRMVATANKHRRHVEFQVGDLVLLKLQPHMQFSVAKPRSAKLARRFYGPFEDNEKGATSIFYRRVVGYGRRAATTTFTCRRLLHVIQFSASLSSMRLSSDLIAGCTPKMIAKVIACGGRL
ncbi:unnamed protein product [Cuscuta campestris]|uniref:Integrase catalytic domain-containing protein n=1 Tax=Cuscuta campestris TaxID=132261 RepID=A0A484MYK4_9ASTE|nr:unnamed protein product [Cuscuta campestris]